jgi:membrane protein implicated in regulation of membrane protease activity
MTLATLFLICFLVGVGVNGVSLFASFANLHHSGGLHFHHHGGGGVVHHAAGGAAPHAGGGSGSLLKSGGALLGHLFNLAAITTFLAWFGGVGLLLQQLTKLPTFLIVLFAIVAGVTGASTVNRIIGALRAREHPLQPIVLAGTLGRLTIPIREGGGTGEVVYTINGTRRVSGARSDENRSISKGTEVVITRYDKGIAYVCEFDRMLHGRETPQITQ